MMDAPDVDAAFPGEGDARALQECAVRHEVHIGDYVQVGMPKAVSRDLDLNHAAAMDGGVAPETLLAQSAKRRREIVQLLMKWFIDVRRCNGHELEPPLWWRVHQRLNLPDALSRDHAATTRAKPIAAGRRRQAPLVGRFRALEHRRTTAKEHCMPASPPGLTPGGDRQPERAALSRAAREVELGGIRLAEGAHFDHALLGFARCHTKAWHRVHQRRRKTLYIIDTYPTGYQVKYCGASILGISLLGHGSV